MRLIYFIICIVFIAWLLPLGVFIKPSEEQIACGGQRAICMCHMQTAKAKQSIPGVFILTANQGSHKETHSSVSGSNYYVAAHQDVLLIAKVFDPFDVSSHAIALLAARGIEHVPKA